MERKLLFNYYGENMKKMVTLACDECHSRNYQVKKNKLSVNRLELNKYCPKCNKVTVHKETK